MRFVYKFLPLNLRENNQLVKRINVHVEDTTVLMYLYKYIKMDI